MLKTIFNFIGSRLWLKVLIPVSLTITLVMAGISWFNISFQNQSGRAQLTTQNQMLARAVEGGMFDALAVGDNDTVRQQFKRLNERAKDIKVYVYDFNGIVSFSTDINAVGQSMDTYVKDGAGHDLFAMLASGNASGLSHKTRQGDINYVIKNDPIPNEQRCFHCHGHKRENLGGISVLSSMSAMEKTIEQGRNTSMFIATAGLLLIILLIWSFFHYLVNNKVKRVMASTARLREKDFTHEYKIAKGDEVNHILARINAVTRELRQTILNIVENSAIILTSSQQTSTIADSLDNSSREASEKASTVSAAAEEMSVNNRSIAETMDEAAQTMGVIAAAVEEMSSTVGEISKNSSESKLIIEQVSQAFESILIEVEELGTRADDVDVVTDQIRSISEQVSMLALNAKIEAARAGEAGKGFAVVAQEITDLAADTGKSTLDADEKLARIKKTSRQLTEKVAGLSGGVKDSETAIASIAAAVEEQNVTTLEIAKNISEISEKIVQVNENVNQGAQVASDIAQDITRVEEMSVQVQENSHNLNENASAMNQMAQNFTDLMKQFKV